VIESPSSKSCLVVLVLVRYIVELQVSCARRKIEIKLTSPFGTLLESVVPIGNQDLCVQDVL